jgi:hypothetical protein
MCPLPPFESEAMAVAKIRRQLLSIGGDEELAVNKISPAADENMITDDDELANEISTLLMDSSKQRFFVSHVKCKSFC